MTHKTRHLIKTTTLLITSSLMIVSYQSCAQWLGGSSHSGGTSSASGVQQNVPVVPFSQAAPILVAHCASCHSPTSATPTTVLPDISNQSAVEGSAYVKMGSPQTSQLYLDIIDGIEPRNMAPNGTGTALTAGELETVREWLLAANINTDVLAGSLPSGSGAVSGSGGGTTSGTVSFSKQIMPIFTAQCVSCHGPNSPTLGSYTQIQPFAQSCVTAITSTTAGIQMPPGSPLSTAQIQLIQQWVNAGTPNN